MNYFHILYILNMFSRYQFLGYWIVSCLFLLPNWLLKIWWESILQIIMSFGCRMNHFRIWQRFLKFHYHLVQVLSQTHWLTQLLDLECRDGHVIHLRGSYGGHSCNSSCSTISELDNCDSGVGSVDCDNNDADTLAEPIDVILGTGKTF